MNKELQAGINWLIKNWNKIPEQYKQNIKDGKDSEVVILLSRQKPSVEQSWDFHEERITINKDGQVIWGFDSGCSCPSPWDDGAPNCYSCSESWKEFMLNDFSGFDEGALEECLETIIEIRTLVEKK